jgi:hypothetical protein
MSTSSTPQLASVCHTERRKTKRNEFEVEIGDGGDSNESKKYGLFNLFFDPLLKNSHLGHKLHILNICVGTLPVA